MQLTNFDHTRIAAEAAVSVPTVRSYLDNRRKTTRANARAIRAALVKLGYAHGAAVHPGGELEST